MVMDVCLQLGAFAGCLPAVRYLTAVAFAWYVIGRGHRWSSEYLQVFAVGQGAYTPQVIRQDGRTKTVHGKLYIAAILRVWERQCISLRLRGRRGDFLSMCQITNLIYFSSTCRNGDCLHFVAMHLQTYLQHSPARIYAPCYWFVICVL